MTTNDWVGLITTVVIFFLMVGVYVYVLRPGAKRLEPHKNIPIDDDFNVSGGKNGRDQ